MSKSTRWCYTLNNYSSNDFPILHSFPTKYHIYGKEVSDSGTPHLQGFLILKSQSRLSAMKKLHPKAHWEVAKGTSTQASDYCKKEGDFEEFGVLSEQGKRTDLQAACALIKSGKSLTAVADELPETFVKFSRGLRELKLVLDKPYTPKGLRGLWYYGPPGTGKSRTAREKFPDAYLKSQNKWWDGYAGEKNIILDDMDTNVLGHYLKIWTDRYPCTGETKGGTVNLQHDVLVITSNYSIEELWPDDVHMQEALTRRFKVTHFNSPLTSKAREH